MKEKDLRNIIDRLVDAGKLFNADAENAKVLADNLPTNTILHFAGETPFVIDETTNSILYLNGDMEDWAMMDFDISALEKTTREHLEEECLLSLKGYAWRESVRRNLPSINAEVFGKEN